MDGLEDVRTLLKRWKVVLAYPVQESGPSMVWKSHRQVEVEEAGLGNNGMYTPKEKLPGGASRGVG